MKIEFQFRYCCGESWPVLDFDSRCPEPTLTSVDISETEKSVTAVCHADCNDFKIFRTSKQHNDTVVKDGQIVRDQVVHLTAILIDDILLDLDLIKDYYVYTPVYSQGYLEWCQENNIDPPVTIHDQSWHFNGEFSFNYQLPFWEWYADIRRKHVIKNFSSKDIETYFGSDYSSHNELLDQLKQLIKSHV